VADDSAHQLPLSLSTLRVTKGRTAAGMLACAFGNKVYATLFPGQQLWQIAVQVLILSPDEPVAFGKAGCRCTGRRYGAAPRRCSPPPLFATVVNRISTGLKLRRILMAVNLQAGINSLSR